MFDRIAKKKKESNMWAKVSEKTGYTARAKSTYVTPEERAMRAITQITPESQWDKETIDINTVVRDESKPGDSQVFYDTDGNLIFQFKGQWYKRIPKI